MKYYAPIQRLMNIFYTEYVGQRLQIPPGQKWTDEDIKNISGGVQAIVEALSMPNKSDDSTVYLAGMLIAKPTYNGVVAEAWLGKKALEHIEYFVKGGEITRFSSRTLAVVSTVMGYREGFLGYRQGKRLEPVLMEQAGLV